MLLGRDLRKSISQAWAFTAFRWVAIWLIIAYCASKGQTGVTAGLVIASVEIVATGSFKGLFLLINDMMKKDWLDRLTDRIFYRMLIEEFRENRGSMIDVEQLFTAATKEAVADINAADEDSTRVAGVFGTTSWHWFGGALSFSWLIVSSILWYGSALYLGSGGTF